ncbi:MAG: hypothetical protein WHT08_01180 [Bryobacteraceae bacterium]|jgi:hypothetical protein
MGLLQSLDEGRIGGVLLLFCIFLAVSLFAFSAGRPLALLKGLFWTLMDLLVAPFAYVRYAVFRLSQEGGKSVRIDVADPQFLLRTAIRIQLAVLFLSLSIIGAFGLLMIVDASVPEEVGEARKQAVVQLAELRNQQLPSLEQALREVKNKLADSSAVENELRAKRSAAASLEAQASALQSRLLESDYSEHFLSIDRFLKLNGTRMSSSEGRNQIREAVESYLRQSPTSEDFDKTIAKYLDLLFEKAEKEAEVQSLLAANSREILQQRQAELQEQLAETRKQEQRLEREASWSRLLENISGRRLTGGFFLLLAVVWAVLWLGGLGIEYAEIVIDIATNLRRLRRVAEGAPRGTVIQPLPAGGQP